MRIASTAAAALMVAGTAQAQDIGFDNVTVGAGVSTLGIFVEPSMPVAPNIEARLPVYLGSYSDTFTDDDNNDFSVDAQVTAAHVMADYYLGSFGFRLSGGLSLGGYKLDADATTPTITFDGTNYTGDFDFTVEQSNNVAPVLAIGIQREIAANFGFTAEIGARITTLEVSATGQEVLSTNNRDDFNADIAEINSDLEDIPAIPFISLGVTYRF